MSKKKTTAETAMQDAQNAQNQAAPCPNCGHCPTCGKNRGTYPWGQYPYYPPFRPYVIWNTSQSSGVSNGHTFYSNAAT